VSRGSCVVSTVGRSLSEGPVRLSGRGLGAAALRASYLLVLAYAVVSTLYYARWAVEADFLGYDFAGTLWDPGVAIREGRSPYPAPVVAEVDTGNPALYPPLLMLAIAPLTVLPWALGVGIWTVLLAASVAATLYILRVRDPRCYLLALATPVATIGLVFGNATLLLVPIVALAWRWRDHQLRSGALVGLAIASKLFVWPLLFWLLGTRRYRAFGAALIATCMGLLVPWAVIGFDGMTSYPDLLRIAEELYAGHSYSVATALSALGTDAELASRATLGLGVAIAAGAFYAGRRGADSASVSLAVLAAVLGSPIVWPYYYALLLVPVAIARPRFSGLWVALALFYVANRLPRELLEAGDLPGRPMDVPFGIWQFNHSPPGLWRAAGYAVVGAGLVAAAVLASRRAKAAS
jgi:glycosyl transferase family 87